MASSSASIWPARTRSRVRITSPALRANALPTRPISARYGATSHHQVGMATSGSLGDVQREITHALDVACGVQSGHHDAQVGGHGRLLYEQGERLLFGGGAEVVNAGVVGDDLLGQPQVCTKQRTRGVVKGFGHQDAHVGETVAESVELLLVGAAHGERVAAFDCR
jgi:hypothetical protein